MKQLLLFLLTALVLGCGGSDKDRGKNSQADRPQPTSSAKQ
jgi:hypothetical protein